MKFIIMTVTPDAQVEVKGQGFKGKSCTKHIDAITKALGKTKQRTNLPEYHQQVEEKQKV